MESIRDGFPVPLDLKEGKLVELKLTVDRVHTAVAERDRSGLRFVKMISYTVAETVTTDRMLVTDKAVRCLNHQR